MKNYLAIKVLIHTTTWMNPKILLLSEGRIHYAEEYVLGFPGGTVVESLPANAGDTGSSPGLGRSHMPRSN